MKTYSINTYTFRVFKIICKTKSVYHSYLTYLIKGLLKQKTLYTKIKSETTNIETTQYLFFTNIC